MMCPHCNGFGSSLKEDAETCTQCKGSGLVCDKCGESVFLSIKALGSKETLCSHCSCGTPDPKVIQINITL